MAPTELGLGDAPEGFRSGFVSIVGRPNVGKSTLLNQILHNKVAITSDRPQTTRNAIRGVHTTKESQLIFIDTPGMHRPRTELGRRLNRLVRDTLDEVDVAVFLLDVTGVGKGDAFIASELQRHDTPVLVVLNKIDAVDPRALAKGSADATALIPGHAPFGISARTGDGVDELVRALVAAVPEGPVLYPPDEITDQSPSHAVAELIREKALELTREEVPHSIAVVVDDMEGKQIHATIYVERDSQKGIVIGKRGTMLKEIGTRARQDVEALLGHNVFLELHVKVARDWQSRDATLERFGYGR